MISLILFRRGVVILGVDADHNEQRDAPKSLEKTMNEQLNLLTFENLTIPEGFQKTHLANMCWHWMVEREIARIRVSQEKYDLARQLVQCVTCSTEDSICYKLPFSEEVKEQIRSITSVNTLRDLILRIAEANGCTAADIDHDKSITRVAREHCADIDSERSR